MEGAVAAEVGTEFVEVREGSVDGMIVFAFAIDDATEHEPVASVC
jgi:hypothetical protein